MAKTSDVSTTPAVTGPARAPQFRRFIVTGALVGFVIGAWVSLSGVFEDTTSTAYENYQYSPSAGVGYLGLMGAFLGALLAAVIAILLDRKPR